MDSCVGFAAALKSAGQDRRSPFTHPAQPGTEAVTQIGLIIAGASATMMSMAGTA
jgi:hypothetical protein